MLGDLATMAQHLIGALRYPIYGVIIVGAAVLVFT